MNKLEIAVNALKKISNLEPGDALQSSYNAGFAKGLAEKTLESLELDLKDNTPKKKVRKEEELFIIMHGGSVYKGTYHDSHEQAANFIKFMNPKRTWKRPDEDTFKCSLSGATFRIVELNK